MLAFSLIDFHCLSPTSDHFIYLAATESFLTKRRSVQA
jgi:hypothetical protein